VLQDLSLNRDEEGAPPVKVIHFDHVISRKAGQRRFVDLHMHMPAEWTLGHAASLRGKVERTLMEAVPGLRVTIQLLPNGVEAHMDDPIGSHK
jgi:divalent metal cation (Fe/Co/Zn/Cd) transporter